MRCFHMFMYMYANVSVCKCVCWSEWTKNITQIITIYISYIHSICIYIYIYIYIYVQISNTKYNLLTFLPLNLIEQFSMHINRYV